MIGRYKMLTASQSLLSSEVFFLLLFFMQLTITQYDGTLQTATIQYDLNDF